MAAIKNVKNWHNNQINTGKKADEKFNMREKTRRKDLTGIEKGFFQSTCEKE